MISPDNTILIGGTGGTIREIAETIREIVAFEDDLRFDDSKPDGVMRKLLSTARLRDLGWNASVDLREGLERTYNWYRQTVAKATSSDSAAG